MVILTQQIRAVYNDKTIRVYQAYSETIADYALEHGTFVSPSFKMERMTWIKPSFLWMMYRSGWGKKDSEQKRILAIDITHEGFEWALAHSCLTHYEKEIYSSKEEWQTIKKKSSVRIQWDPERNLFLQPLAYRTIQIGLSKEAVELYVDKWIRNISDLTTISHRIYKLIEQGKLNNALALLPKEKVYSISTTIKKNIGSD